jgi:hypothetical protein
MSEVVERVARAIYDAADPTSGDCVAEALMNSPFVGDGGRDALEDVMAICRSAARAAILAMREPTEAMENIGEAELGDNKYPGAATIWAAMIDEALR